MQAIQISMQSIQSVGFYVGLILFFLIISMIPFFNFVDTIQSYRNFREKHVYEKETKTRIFNLIKLDKFKKEEKRILDYSANSTCNKYIDE